MSISDNYAPVKVLGDGVTTEFSANWNVLSSSYILVYLEDVTTGAQVLQTLDSNYSLTFNDAGLTVDFSISTAPTSSDYVVIARNVTQEQGAPYSTSTGFQGVAVENSLDKLTAMVQDVQDDVDRAAKTPVGNNPLSFPSYSAGLNIGWSDSISGTLVNGTSTVAEIDAAVVAVAALAAESGVKVSDDDTTVGFLDGKLIAGSGLGFTVNNPASNETLTIDVVDASETVKGVVEAATTAEMTAGAADKFPDAAKVKAAIDAVGIVDSDFSTEGYVELGGGLIMQWGRKEDIATVGTFPLEWPNGCLNMVASHDSTGYSDNGVSCEVISTTEFQVRSGTGVNAGVFMFWQAIGH